MNAIKKSVFMLMIVAAIAHITAYSKVVSTNKIKSITELNEIIGPVIKYSSTHFISEIKFFIVFDWDNTISNSDGCLLPLREGLNTKKIIKELIDNKNVYPMIMTASSKEIRPMEQIYPFPDALLKDRTTDAKLFCAFAQANKFSFNEFGLGNTIRFLLGYVTPLNFENNYLS